jgi:diguanylate cyclase (GGDEF)-like protein/PAS domain S-box-containing protein
MPEPAAPASDTLVPGHVARALVQHASDVILTYDPDGRFRWINPAGERLFGYAAADLRSMALADIVAPESLATATDAGRRAAAGEVPPPVELDVIARDGRRVAVDAAATPLVIDGRIEGVQVIARDLGPRRRAEEALRHSEQRFRVLVENSADGLLLVSPEGRIFFASNPVMRWLGYAPEEFVGRHLLDLLHADDRDRVAWVLAEALDQPATTLHAQYRCRHRDGSWRLHEAAVVNHLSHPGINAIVVNFRDVTDRRAAEMALHESEERFRAVFESALIGIVRLDLQGQVIEANRAFQEMSGNAPAEIAGRPLVSLLHADDVQPALRDLAALVSGQRSSFRAERRFIARGGTVLWANETAALVRDEAGAAQFVLAMFENITERKQAEADLRDTNARLSVWIEELEQRTKEIELLSDMGDLLQACRSPEEACAVVVPIAARLFPDSAGVVSVVAGRESRVVDPIARWGTAGALEPFGLADCWALRRGRLHLVADRAEGPRCLHLEGIEGGGTVCVPMIAHGEILGVLSLVVRDGATLTDPRQRLVLTVAEHVSLALANLELQETLRSQSIRDPLTGLFNRRYMEESLEREMRRAVRSRSSVGIIMLDVDHFKPFNDTHGHDAGDELLRELGAALQRSIRAEDIACRYGGEEFTLILPEASLHEAAQRADAVRHVVKGLVVSHRRQALPPVTISAGVAIFPEHGPTAEAVLRAADTALYQAKARGRDRVVLNQTGGLFPDAIVEFTRR